MSLFALVDCNNFYASCERVFQPHLKNRPVVVLSNNDACIIARSQEAKALAIQMGAPFFKIKPQLEQAGVAIFSSNYALYGDMSQRVMNILQEHCAEVEVYSIDESFLLLDFYNLDKKGALQYGERLRKTVLQGTGIPVSVGIACTKTLAKLANHIAKRISKSGVYFIAKDAPILEQISIAKVWGIGKGYLRRLAKINVQTIRQLQQLSEQWMYQEFGVVGLRLLKELKGIACYALDAPIEQRQQMIVSRSFPSDITDLEQLYQHIAVFATRLGQKLRSYQQEAACLQVFLCLNRHKNTAIRQTYFTQAITLPLATSNTNELIHWAKRLVKYLYRQKLYYKKAGILANDLRPLSEKQLHLFHNVSQQVKYQKVNALADAINKKMGKNTVYFSACGKRPKFKHRQEYLSQRYTTNWEEILKIKL